MNAGFSAFKTTVFFCLVAALAAAPLMAQPAFTAPANGTVFPLTTSIQVEVSVNAYITFNVSIAYTNGDPNWLELYNGSCTSGTGYETSATIEVYLQPGCSSSSLSAGTHTANVTLNAVSPSGVSPLTFQVTYNTSGNTSGTIVASPSSLTGANVMSAAVGGTAQALVTLTTASSSPIGFTISPGASWLTVTANVYQVNSSSSSTLTFKAVSSATESTLSSGTYTATTIINYGTSQTVSINVTFDVGAGSVTLSPSALNWTYGAGTLSPSGFQNTTLTTPNTDSYTAVISYPPAAPATNWLEVNNSSTSVSSLSNGSMLAISLANYSSLATGSYTATVTVTDNGNTSNSGSLTVTLSVTSSTPANITVTPASVTLNSSDSYDQVLTVGSAAGGSLSVTYTPTNSWLNVTPSANVITPSGTATVTVTGNTTVAQTGTYTGSITITVGSATQTVPVTMTAGTGTGTVGGSFQNVAPTTLNFLAQSGGSDVTQQVVFAGNGSFNVSSEPIYSTNSGSVAWLAASTVSGNMSAQGTPVTFYAKPASLSPGTYTASVPLSLVVNGQPDESAPSLAMNFVVTAGEVLQASPGTLLLNSSTTTGTLNVTASGGTALPVAVSTDQNWLSATIQGGVTTTPATISVSVSTAGMANGLYAGNVLVAGGTTPTLYVPVVVVVTGSTVAGGLTVSSSSLTFGAVTGGTPPGNQTLAVGSSTSGTAFTMVVTVSTPSGGGWLSVTPASNLVTPQILTVSVNQAGLPSGTYSGNIGLTANGTTLEVPVSLVVSATGTTGGNLTVSPTSMAFSATVGGAAPTSQPLSITSASGATGVTFTAAASSTGNWLSVSPTTGTTPASLTVAVNQTNLSNGSYSGTITVTPQGGSAVLVTVTLNVVSQPTISVTPPFLAFEFQAGSGGSVAPGQLTVTATGGTASYSAIASSSGNWLSVSPATGSTSTTANLAVTVNPAGLAANTTPYSGTITVTGTNGTTGSATIDVTLTVTSPLPVISSVLNAANYVNGPVSPGEIVSIFGTSIGPTNPAFLTLNSTGTTVLNSIGGVQVFFSGYPAPLTYVSATQINCVVPYELANSKEPFVKVVFAGQSSNEPSLQLAASAPGIFTQNSQGTGAADVLNHDNTLNTEQNPEAIGNVIQIFMTGEGLTTPAQADGTVTPVNTSGTGPLTPAPQLPVTVMINNQPAASLPFVGEAPGLVAGVLQVNATIPAGAFAGANSLTVQVGKNISQSGVTVWVK